jgi:hypothetical protein
VLDIDVGSACSDDNTTMMVLSAAMTKNCNAVWTAGSGGGALDTGSALGLSTWYHVYLIERTDTQVVDVLLSANATLPAMPASYTKKRRIGSIRTDASSHILAFSQLGDQFIWAVPFADYSNNAVSTTAVAVPLSVPSGVKVRALFRSNSAGTAAGAGVLITSLDEAAAAYNVPSGNISAGTQVASQGIAFVTEVRTNTSGQIRVVASASGTTLIIATYGWLDERGK